VFLLSGLFVWRSLSHKGPRSYLRARLLRLALPFAVAVLTVVPLTYYPSFRLGGSQIGFGAFWTGMVVTGPWPSGPPWFLALLLLFDGGAALVFGFARNQPRIIASRAIPGAATCFGVLVAASAVAYLPLLALFGPLRWFSYGPFAVQASRIGLYALYFGAGVAIGANGLARPQRSWSRGMPLFGGAAGRRWVGWAVLAMLSGAALVVTQALSLRAGTALPAWAWSGLHGVVLVAFCAAACLALLGVFLRFGGEPAAAWDRLAANAFGIYLLHYPAVTWAQYGLLGAHLGAVAKAALVFAAALLLSWGAASLLRRVPGVARVL